MHLFVLNQQFVLPHTFFFSSIIFLNYHSIDDMDVDMGIDRGLEPLAKEVTCLAPCPQVHLEAS